MRVKSNHITLLQVPKKEMPGMFSFLQPLAPQTWFFVILAYFVFSVALYMLGRFTPYEHVR